MGGHEGVSGPEEELEPGSALLLLEGGSPELEEEGSSLDEEEGSSPELLLNSAPQEDSLLLDDEGSGSPELLELGSPEELEPKSHGPLLLLDSASLLLELGSALLLLSGIDGGGTEGRRGGGRPIPSWGGFWAA